MNTSTFEASVAVDQFDVQVRCTRGSTISFWCGCTGLAVLANVIPLLVQHVSAPFDQWLLDTLFPKSGGRVSWQLIDTHAFVWDVGLIPSLVMASIVPILCWRGSLWLRCALSLVISITAMNLSAHLWVLNEKFGLRWMGAAEIAACWISLPILLVLVPFLTRPLRMFVFSGVLVLSICISIFIQDRAPSNASVLYWLMLYSVVASLALVRRNWGNLAFLEAETTTQDVERTSSGTLLELMAVCSLGLATAISWWKNANNSFLVSPFVAVILGVTIFCATMYVLRLYLNGKTIRVSWVFLLGAACWLEFSALGATISRYGFLPPPRSAEITAMAIASGFAASLILLGHTLICAWWLKKCGWQLQSTS